MMRNTAPPIFIIGVHRSGTTLLRFILSSHPNIYIPPESDFIPRFFLNEPQQKISPREVKNYLDFIFREYRFAKEWQAPPPDPDDFFQQMLSPTPAGFLDALYRQYAQQYQAHRWGDKTPIYASYVDLLDALFPHALFLHIIRDPRDAALSLLEKYAAREYHVDIFFAARNWVRRIKKARRDGLQLGEHRYLEIHYEDLVQNPEELIQQMCDFIGVKFHSAMLQHFRLAEELIPEESHFFNQVRKPIGSDRIGRWQQLMPEMDIRLIEAVCGNLLQKCGYTRKFEHPLSLRVGARILVLGSKYFILQSGRKILELAGWLPPI